MAIETNPAVSNPGVEVYLDLVRAFPLRPIRSNHDHGRAIETINAMADRRHEWGTAEEDYFLVLALLIERYESAIYGEPSDSE
jgi:HTH-type transcriptional regulator / antitoxin HigA